MSTAVLINSLPRRWQLSSVANTTLTVAARSWFVVTVVGQLFFAFAIASFYSLTALRGDYQRLVALRVTQPHRVWRNRRNVLGSIHAQGQKRRVGVVIKLDSALESILLLMSGRSAAW